jgi:hypothetical protein
MTTTTATLTFRPNLGVLPFHLGCNALVVHPNCGLCNPHLRGEGAAKAATRRARIASLPDLFADDGGIPMPCETFRAGDPCACGRH